MNDTNPSKPDTEGDDEFASLPAKEEWSGIVFRDTRWWRAGKEHHSTEELARGAA
jgi:hypothetical protein